jgi:hypothetical protein
MIAFSFGRGAHEEAARVRREGLDVHLVTVADLMDRLDEVLVRMSVTTASGLLPGLEATPLPEIGSTRPTADELVRSAKAQSEDSETHSDP